MPSACTVALAAAALVLAAAPAAAGLELQLASERSRGLYGDATATTIASQSTTLRWRGERWLAQVELPWLAVRNAAGAAGLPEQAGRSGDEVERGWGDAWLKLAWTAREYSADTTGIDLVAKWKASNASSQRGLGSGAQDWVLQIDLSRRWGAVTAFAEIGYRRTGDRPGARPYNNPWQAEVGAQLSPAAGVDVGMYHDARERIGSLGPLHETTAFAAWRSGSQRWQLQATRGATRASVKQAIGLSWRLRGS